MTATRAVVFVSATAISLIPALLTAYSGGPPVRRTGAPGDRTCLDATCHVGARFNASADLTLETGVGSHSYTPGGAAQRWTIRIGDTNARAYGLQLSVRSGSDLAQRGAGSLTAVEPLTSVICNDEQFKGAAGCPGVQPVEFLHHVEPKRTGTFAVEWTPPSSASAGDAVVYVIANASVSGQRNARIHQRAFLIRPAGGPSVVNAASLAEGISPGAWITIFGRGFAGAGELQVRVNGLPATVGYSSDTQINALSPDHDELAGPVPVEVRRGQTLLATVVAMQQRAAPALFTLTHENAVLAVATHADGTPATGPGARPIRPGVLLHLYATGLDASSATARFGDGPPISTVPTLASPGLHRLELTVPALPEGLHPLAISSGGVSSPSGVQLAISR